ncbi:MULTISPECIES: helix-turn-helix domain-containing protein [unclassified Paracoccus (in: a-proteobacteria)]|uniref:helix-turn-helix domain-containing protein n=1 Tax=unclassified Paracoccus (in: a-proteobacteria) TaxID=2688777 RepID=UPI0021E16053|nr:MULTISPECIES: helix-turn-helix domain-containing protein [unclassified Paracoccus (in: a-proteobacteria)]UXU76310.1 helix-turn-helix domain-containing protein [Paracoccus sp. SMMA_5]UXU82353.1 helix-turn-helix domain-containing protein [Paracoccus sp. SMMA_5_TC]
MTMVASASREGPPDVADAAAWRAAQAELAPALAAAATQLGRLDQLLTGLPEIARAGALLRLALIEVEAMLWAQGSPLRREDIGRDLMEARASADLEAMRLARWGIRRLEGQGDAADLRGFLGLHRAETAGLDGVLAARPTGDDFDAAAQDFAAHMAALAGMVPLALGPAVLGLWRLCGLSPPERLVEPAVWSARAMAGGAEILRFVPLGRHGRAVWVDGGPQAARLARHLAAVSAGLAEARHELMRLCDWRGRALAATARIKGDTPAEAIAALFAHPLLSAPMLERQAGISRDTAERMLARLQSLGLAREITGGRRFRLWTSAG